MNQLNALESALDTLQQVIDAAPIDNEQGGKPTPCADFTVDDLGTHIIDTHNLLLTGAGGVAIIGDGTLSERNAALTSAAIKQWTQRGTDGTVDLGGNELPASFALSLHTLEAYIHAWDLAQSLGRPFEPSEELTDDMWAFAQDFISDDVRGEAAGGPYGPAIAVGADASVIDRLIAHSGRNPNWRDDS